MLWTLCVSYDLQQPGKDYTELINYLKSFGTWCHVLESTWFIVTDKSPQVIREEAQKVTDSNDKIVVVRAAPPGAWSNLPTDISEWMKKNL